MPTISAAYSRLFAKDGEWIGGFGSVKGPAAIEAFMAKNIGTPGKPSGTYHQLTNFIIDVHGDTATAWSRWAYVTPGPDKKPAIAQGGHYEDTLVRENGQWKFSRREAFVDIPHPSGKIDETHNCSSHFGDSSARADSCPSPPIRRI